MKQTLHLTVALDLTPEDQHVLAYSALMCSLLPVRKISFVHVEAHLSQGLDVLQDTVAQHFHPTQALEQEFEVLEGRILDELLEHVSLKEIDLLVLGKSELRERDSLSAQMARRLPCSVLFVPPQASREIRNVLVPTDFSDISIEAANLALALSSVLTTDVVHFLHLYHVPDSYYELGDDYETARLNAEKYAEADYRIFESKLKHVADNQIRVHLKDDHERQKMELIAETLQRQDCQLLVMGSKGRTNVAALFLGSFAEKVVKAPLGVPVLVVKPEHNMGFLQALLEVSEA